MSVPPLAFFILVTYTYRTYFLWQRFPDNKTDHYVTLRYYS